MTRPEQWDRLEAILIELAHPYSGAWIRELEAEAKDLIRDLRMAEEVGQHQVFGSRHAAED